MAELLKWLATGLAADAVYVVGALHGWPCPVLAFLLAVVLIAVSALFTAGMRGRR